MAGERFVVWNRTRGSRIAASARRAGSFWSSARGWIGRRPGEETDDGLLLPGCRAVHTAFVRGPLDLLFLDRSGRVAVCVPHLAPWRLAWARGPGLSALELPPGRIGESGTKVDDRIEFRPCESPSSPKATPRSSTASPSP